MVKALNQSPNLLYFCDFLPSNLNGGTILIGRLLGGYPTESLTALVGSYFYANSPNDGRLACKHIVFPSTSQTGTWGTGRLNSFAEWLLIPVLCAAALWTVHRRRIQVIVTVADGHFFIAAALTSLVTGIPLILVVHDDWVSTLRRNSYILKFVCRPIFWAVCRKAAHIYAISPWMEELLRTEYGVASEVQLPATEPLAGEPVHRQSTATCEGRAPRAEGVEIAYAGSATGAIEDSLKLLVDVVTSDQLAKCGIPSASVHLYSGISEEQARNKGMDHTRVALHGWLPQPELRNKLAQADILFLPLSFRQDQGFITTRSFPSKTADYLALGRPVLVLAPPHSTIARYAAEFGFAEVVTEPSQEALAKSIHNIWQSKEYQCRMQRNAAKAFQANHNIRSQQDKFAGLVRGLAKWH